METIHSKYKRWVIILSGFPAFFSFGGFVAAQIAPTQTQNGSSASRDQDASRRELANFDEFLDAHREIAEQVRRDPSLLDNKQFLKDHPELQRYLWNHPGVREEVRQNPTAFMHQEERYDRREDTAAREAMHEKLASFNQFLDKHPEVAEQVRKDPSLLDNPQYLKDQPELQAYLQDHEGVRNTVRQNPTAIMNEEDRYEQRVDTRDRDRAREELANFDQFLDKDRELAEQLRKNPSLLDNQKFLKDHPDLQAYLRDHPGARSAVMENPTAFMHEEERYDQREEPWDKRQEELASFTGFLNKHAEIAEQVRKDPSLLDSPRYLKEHPELQAYLQDHEGVRNAIRQNPSAFMVEEKRFDQREDALDREVTRREFVSFDEFLDRHHEVAEQVEKNPSLLDNQQFLKDHPALEAYLQDHPGVRQEVMDNPNTFMRMEDHSDQRELDRSDPDLGHRRFGEFLGRHADIARDLSRDASLVRRGDYMHSHPEFEAYLTEHPDDRQQLMADPQGFFKSSQQFMTTKPSATDTAGKPTTVPAGQQPKP